MKRTLNLVVALLALGLLLLPVACGTGSGTDGGNDCSDGVGVDEDGDTYRTCGLDDLIDCDDGNADVNPGASEICGDGADNDCNGAVDDADVDDDGIIDEACGGADCDDLDPEAYPGRSESCDGADNDCDGEIDDGFDADNDGWTSCAGDCDNTDPRINPDAAEECNGLDDDCDCLDTPVDTNDDGVLCGPGDRDVDEDFDLDEDGFISTEGFCADLYGPTGEAAASGDCDDSDAETRPGAHEDSSDGFDNDCDGCLDECQDADGDGYDTCDIGAAGDATCAVPGENLSDDGLEADCDDSPLSLFAENVHPDTTFSVVTSGGDVLQMEELCDRVDNDCDGTIDEGYDENCNPLE